MARFLVTTLDNPFNPFTQFEDWYRFDTEKGYNTCSYLARIAKTSPELSESDQERAINNAVNDIVRLNILGIYKKIEEPSDLEHENSEKTVSLQQNNDLGATTDVGNHPNDI